MRRLAAAVPFLLLLQVGCDCRPTDRARIPKQVDVREPNNLSPPRVSRPIRECAEAVYVDGFAPGAVVRVYADGVEVGTSVPHFGFADVDLTQALAVGQSVAATQSIDGVESAPSLDPVVVEAWPPGGALPKPDVDDELYECGRVVPVGNLLESCRVKVTEAGTLRGQAEAPGTWKPVVTNAGLTKGQPVSAQAFACEGDPAREIKSTPADDVAVQPAPDPMQAPKLEPGTVVVGNDAVVLDNLYIGAAVAVLQGGSTIGGGFATAKRNRAPLSTPIDTGPVTATQELCEVSDKASPVTPSTELSKPRIYGPLCDDDTSIFVNDTILNATVAVQADAGVVALGGAGESGIVELSLGTPLQAGQTVVAIQSMGENVSDASDPVKVCCCTEKCWGDVREELGDDWPRFAPRACGASPAPLFAAGSNDVIEIDLQADFDLINDPAVAKDDAHSPGTLTWTEGGSILSASVEVQARGKSRFQHCGFRPLSIIFPSTPPGTQFQAVTDKLKVVTHCGNHPTDPWILGGTPEVQRRRLLAEYYIYEVLERLESTALDTRLALITYRKPDASVILTEYGILREREDAACVRCGLIDEASDAQTLTPNETSVFQGELYNEFVFMKDFGIVAGHNTIRCFDSASQGFYIPYDWDLNGVVRPDYFKNTPFAPYQDHATHLRSFLDGSTPVERTRAQVFSIVQLDGMMEQVLDDSLLDAQGKLLLRQWYRLYMATLKCWLSSR